MVTWTKSLITPPKFKKALFGAFFAEKSLTIFKAYHQVPGSILLLLKYKLCENLVVNDSRFTTPMRTTRTLTGRKERKVKKTGGAYLTRM